MNKNNGNVLMTEDTRYMISTKNDYNAVRVFQMLMESTFLKNEKSVYWNGSQAFVIMDNSKDDTILKEGLRYCDIKLLNFFEEWSAMFTDSNGLTFSRDRLLSRTKEDYFLLDETHYFRIRKVNYNICVSDYYEDENFIDVTDSIQNEKLSKRYKEYSIYRGIKECQDSKYAGFAAIVDGYSDNAYELSYFSKGDMFEICKSAFAFINGFCDAFF
jgi:hypothetical protein